jgi:hypothetical protein
MAPRRPATRSAPSGRNMSVGGGSQPSQAPPTRRRSVRPRSTIDEVDRHAMPLLPLAGEHPPKYLSCGAIVHRQGVRVPIEHGRDLGPAATLRDHLRIDTRPQELGRHEMPKVVQTALRKARHPPAKMSVLPRGRVRPPRFLTNDVVREHVGIRRQRGSRGGRPLDLTVVVSAERGHDVRIKGDVAAGALRARGRPIDWPGGTRPAAGMGSAVGPDHDHPG